MVKDPVCGMKVEVEEAPVQTTYREKTYYFCCPACRDKFKEEPEKFI